ncbi:hypothetical protein [Kitasatospora camelliae]|uniref:Uncharacterized protein n=1 Tax=Kitasatospora camelliae TaxID=3156397 RepID=A0AAU8JRW8_9ACTN
MICPHCQASLLRRERTDRTCAKCRRRFALDPKQGGSGFSDLRLRELVRRLTEDGRLAVTVEQLCYARERRRPGAQGPRPARGRGRLVGSALAVPVAAVLGVLAGTRGGPAALVSGVAAAAVLLLSVLLLRRGPAGPAARPVRSDWTAESFRRSVLAPWREVYGELPAGVVEREAVVPGPVPAEPVAALLCPDPAIGAFLHANAFPQRHGVVLAAELRSVPPGLPLVVLHDASPSGCLLVEQARAALPGRRIVDAGLPPRALLEQPRAPRLREPGQARSELARLRAGGRLSAAELDWLDQGWWSPLAAARPATVLAAAGRAVSRASAEDPARTKRRALTVGFLTWPGEGAT